MPLPKVDMDQDIKWPIKNLCIFCGSSSPKDQIYADSAVSLTKDMLARGIGLVYGGGTHGMMGIVGKSVSEGTISKFMKVMTHNQGITLQLGQSLLLSSQSVF